MGNYLVGFTTGQRGIELAETGVNIESFEVDYSPQYKDKVNQFNGQVIGWAITDKLTRVVTMSGKWTNAGMGILAAVFATAVTFANDVAEFVAVGSGTSSGGFYMDKMVIGQTNDGWRTFNATLTSDPLVT